MTSEVDDFVLIFHQFFQDTGRVFIDGMFYRGAQIIGEQLHHFLGFYFGKIERAERFGTNGVADDERFLLLCVKHIGAIKRIL